MRSMTGFGVGEAFFNLRGDEPAAPGSDKLTIEIRAVNHRFLDVRVRVPNNLPDLGTLIEGLARERLTRGRFDISIRLDGADLGAMVIDRDRARSVFHALNELRDELAPGAEIPLSILASVPDLFVPSIEREGEAIRAALATSFDAALRALDKMRLREGVSLAEDVARRLTTVRRLMEAITARAPLIVDGYKKRLRDRAERLRLASDIEVEPGRLEQEVALFADRIDVAEELTRLEGHCAHLETLLLSAEAVGRRLDFLLQEMAREANTIGAKSQDLGIAHAVVELKAEIERMREQVQNVE
jgi:uncharacterized protein (TIGR00255 family)